ncbi:aspartyl protease family protein 1 isoform X2 [Brachypodium distachyon]|uniref:Peptidase A1 domain-containing protein n=1 Tax=Brachypodium distachyon TaxID=15368 RepID=I1GVB9_BRADI|nr:aspartyl protease family protein 1 isoform X2 [Brachypodium distachyon]KQK16726.1 hypothetical protein BRADI_1g30230v3 [Brachypodium distachyon]PNT75319.1 hypothetical protein BRADI_1g30230v3 [Brachypodium distachyon]|eukprot:XP_003560331.2 aspartyl protease family protein 1 isoform X2 [Brachypodium distachyon]
MAYSSSCRGILLFLLAAAVLVAGDGGGVGFDLHHRFSPVVKRWAESRGRPAAAAWWPEGSPEYYSALSAHDRARRVLAGGKGESLLSFADGNSTTRHAGSLHYAKVALGTPNATFVVALDTGSDLFWVPCDCKRCAPIANTSELLKPYSPRQSSTSKPVTCSHSLCDRPNACGNGNGSCPYTVKYVSANTSSSGVLVEDVLYMTRQSSSSRSGNGGNVGEAVGARVVFGCGQEQTGAFLDGAAMEGLLGLGMDRVSVPSLLAAAGLVGSDSFSMCFSPDGNGRINFGEPSDAGAQNETPFIVSKTRPTYNISVTAVNVKGKGAMAAEFAAVVDSGTSFTYLNDPAYSLLATSFNSQVREKRANLSASIPFEYCYALSRGQTEVLMPEVSLTTRGGAVFPVTRPFVIVAGETTDGQVHAVGYCLAVFKSDIPIDIIGQNFMTGLKVVFDRQRSVLGWTKFDCYKNMKVEDDGSPAAAPGPMPVTQLRPRQSDTPFPGAVQPRSAAGHALSSFSPAMLLVTLVAAAAAVL